VTDWRWQGGVDQTITTGADGLSLRREETDPRARPLVSVDTLVFLGVRGRVE